MIQKRYGVPALVLGLALVGGGTSYAFAPNLSTEALSSFSADEQTAIQKAFEIRQTADKEAEAVLTEAGVTKEELRDAFGAEHKKQHEARATALEANDYDAFVALQRNGPQSETITKEVFAKLVKMHALMEEGDRDGAEEIRKELKDEGLMGPMGKGPFGPGMKGERKSN